MRYNIIKIKIARNKKMKYNKKDIMETAWSLFRQGIWTSDLEHVIVWAEPREATFAECLKEAWAHEKELVQEIENKKIDLIVLECTYGYRQNDKTNNHMSIETVINMKQKL